MKILTKNLALFIVVILMTTQVMFAHTNPRKSDTHAFKVAAIADLSGNIEYDFAKSSIRAVYFYKLNKLAKYMVENNTALTLRGFTDSIGTFKGNWKLSEKRAGIVKGYLIKKGVNSDKVITTAFGSTEPLTTNQNASGRQKNRRVEIKLNMINQ